MSNEYQLIRNRYFASDFKSNNDSNGQNIVLKIQSLNGKSIIGSFSSEYHFDFKK